MASVVIVRFISQTKDNTAYLALFTGVLECSFALADSIVAHRVVNLSGMINLENSPKFFVWLHRIKRSMSGSNCLVRF